MSKESRDNGTARVTVSLFGAGDGAGEQARALRGIDGVGVMRVEGTGDNDLLEHLASTPSDAVAFTQTVADLPGAIRRVVMAGRHVLVTAAVALASKQLLALDEVAEKRGRVILFDACGIGDERLPFVRKMTGGEQPLWRPRYIRSVSTGGRDGASLDEQAIGDISLLLSLVDGLPVRVSAVAPRADDESGAADVALVTMAFDGGMIVRSDISMIEPYLRREIVIACDGRAIVLDALDVRAPLQIQASARHRGPQASGQWAETVSEHPIGDYASPTAVVAAEFVRAVRARDVHATNARALASASLVWEMARESMRRGGETVALVERACPARDAGASPRRPEMRVIRGGGRRSTDRPAPELTLVDKTSPPQSA